MLLAVDVGNTQTHLGAFEGEELARDWRLDHRPERDRGRARSHDLRPARARGTELRLARRRDRLHGRPPARARVRAALPSGTSGKRCLLVGPSVKTGMPILVDNPHELGADRLVNAVAAHAKVKGACVAVDFGTSTNFDVVSGAGEYLGGVIGPGVEVSLEALTARAAKLPRIDLSAPEGRDRQAHHRRAIQSGFAYGFAGLVDGIDRRLADELGEKATFIATGGLAHTIAPLLRDDRRGRRAAHPARAAADLRAQHLGRAAAAHIPVPRSATSRSPTASCSLRWPGSATGSCGCRRGDTGPGWPSRRWSRASGSTTATSAPCRSCFGCIPTSTRSRSSSSARTRR